MLLEKATVAITADLLSAIPLERLKENIYLRQKEKLYFSKINI